MGLALRQATSQLGSPQGAYRGHHTHCSNKKAPFTITLGVVGDRCLRALDKPTALKAEGYLLKVAEKGIVIIGADERGLYYGVQTLLQSMEGGKCSMAP